LAYNYCNLVSLGELVHGGERREVRRRLEQNFKMDKKSSVQITEKRGLIIRKKISPEDALMLQKKMLKMGLKTSISIHLDREIFVDGLRSNHPSKTQTNYEVSFDPRTLIPMVAMTPSVTNLRNDDCVTWFKVSMPGVRFGYKFLLMVSLYLAVAMVIVISGLMEPVRGMPVYILQLAGFVLSVLFVPLLFEPQRQFVLSADPQNRIQIVDAMSWNPLRRTYRVFDESDKPVAAISHSRMDPLNTETCAVDGRLMFFNESNLDADEMTEGLASEIGGSVVSSIMTTILMMLPDVFRLLLRDAQQKEYCRVHSGDLQIATLFETKRSNRLKMTDVVPDKTTHLIVLAHCLVSFGV
jgi:hypothetical protein